MREPTSATGTVRERAWLRFALLALLVEKVIQHIAVTVAFASDWDGLRASVALPYQVFMVMGAALVPVFALAAWWLYRRDRWARGLIIALALTDIVGEFVAQGGIAITITVSLLVAVALLALALVYRPRRATSDATLRRAPHA
jgi:hypothetical protein